MWQGDLEQVGYESGFEYRERFSVLFGGREFQSWGAELSATLLFHGAEVGRGCSEVDGGTEGVGWSGKITDTMAEPNQTSLMFIPKFEQCEVDKTGQVASHLCTLDRNASLNSHRQHSSSGKPQLITLQCWNNKQTIPCTFLWDNNKCSEIILLVVKRFLGPIRGSGVYKIQLTDLWK